jgi:hypothetical protein
MFTGVIVRMKSLRGSLDVALGEEGEWQLWLGAHHDVGAITASHPHISQACQAATLLVNRVPEVSRPVPMTDMAGL